MAPLGEATELAVTLEEVLLAARGEAEPIEKRSRPSRRSDIEPSRSAAGPAASGAGAAELERPPLRLPYPRAARRLIRDFFTPAPATDTHSNVEEKDR
jgi:hypothetical protein